MGTINRFYKEHLGAHNFTRWCLVFVYQCSIVVEDGKDSMAPTPVIHKPMEH